MSDIVVDASAILALLNREQGYDRVAAIVEQAVVSAVNLAEVMSRLADQGMGVEDMREAIGNLGLTIVPFDAALAERAAPLRPVTRAQGLSLGDRACLALAQHLGAPVLTADQAWRGVDVGVEIQHLR